MKKLIGDKKIFLFGLSVSLVLAMAIGSFAISEVQTPVTPQVQTLSLASTNDGDTGAFNVTGNGEYGPDKDYHFKTTTDPDSGDEDKVLCIHPQSSDTSFEIKNKDPETETQDRIEITAGPNDTNKTVNITLNGVNISAYDAQGSINMGAAFKIAENAEFNVNITLADNSKNYLTSNYSNMFADRHAGLEKSDDKTTEADIAKLGTLTIGVPSDSTLKNGMLEANGGFMAAGIGGGVVWDTARMVLVSRCGSNITITGGVINANGGQNGAGIGSSQAGAGRHITITDGVVNANGGDSAAGIGGGSQTGEGINITITGGVVNAKGSAGGAGIGGGAGGKGTDISINGGTVTAIGGWYDYGKFISAGSGIGGGSGEGGYGKRNTISGSAVVMAASGDTSQPALKGFDDASEGKIEQSIIFKGVATAFDGQGRATAESWTESEMYDNVTLSESLEIPIDLTIPAGKTLSIKEGKTVALTRKDSAKYTVEGTLQNDGTVTLPTNLEFGTSGKITTLLNYDPQGGSIKTNDDNYITYQDASGVKKYENLPEATKEGYDLEGWHTEKIGKEGTKVKPTDNVLLNQHTLYANWVEPGPGPTPTPPGPEPTPTPPEPQPGPEPTPTPEPTPDPSVNPDGGDGSGSSGGGSSSKTSDPFMGGIALALLGVATTGAILTHKLR